MRNLCGMGKELTAVVNGESVRLTRSSRSLDTRPLRAFIITSICSFIACISVKTEGGVASTRDGMLTFRRSSRLGALLPSGPSRSRRSALESPRSSAILLSAFRCSCSSKTWFCLVRRSTAAVRPVLAFLEQSVTAHLPEHCWWLPLIEWVPCNSFVGGALAVAYDTTHLPTDGANWWCLENQEWDTRQTCDHNDTCTTQKRGPNREHRCGVGQIPSEGQVRTSHNSRVLERGQLYVPWLVRVLELL